MMNLVVAMHCKLNSRRLSRYIDRDSSAPLTDSEILKVESHLAECDKCTAAFQDMTKMKSTMRWLGSSQILDESSIKRLKQSLKLNFKEIE